MKLLPPCQSDVTRSHPTTTRPFLEIRMHFSFKQTTPPPAHFSGCADNAMGFPATASSVSVSSLELLAGAAPKAAPKAGCERLCAACSWLHPGYATVLVGPAESDSFFRGCFDQLILIFSNQYCQRCELIKVVILLLAKLSKQASTAPKGQKGTGRVAGGLGNRISRQK